MMSNIPEVLEIRKILIKYADTIGHSAYYTLDEGKWDAVILEILALAKPKQ